MACWRVYSGLFTIVIYTVLCLDETLGETDKYRDIHKRIFCNMAGCGNMVHGKRDHFKSKLYNMFNRPAGKRSQAPEMESPPRIAKADLTRHDLDRQYSEWSPDSYEAMDTSLPYSDYEDSNVNYPPSDDQLLYSNQMGFDRPQFTLNEKYRALKAAEELLNYVNTIARGKIQRSKPIGRQSDDFNSDWTGKRK